MKRQRVWQYLLTTGTPQPPIDPPPLALTCHADFVVSIACFERLHCQWREVTPLALWKINTHPQANWDNSRLLKVGYTSCSPMCPHTGSRIIEGMAKKRKVQIGNAQKVRHQLNPFFFFFLNRGEDVKIHLQSAFSYSPTVVTIKAKQTLPALSTLCGQTDYNLKKIFLLVA